MALGIDGPASYVRDAERCVRALGATNIGYTGPFTSSLVAGLLGLAGDRAGGRVALEEAVAGYRTIGMRMHAALGERALGGKVDREWLEDQELVDPDRLTQALLPGARLLAR